MGGLGFLTPEDAISRLTAPIEELALRAHHQKVERGIQHQDLVLLQSLGFAVRWSGDKLHWPLPESLKQWWAKHPDLQPRSLVAVGMRALILRRVEAPVERAQVLHAALDRSVARWQAPVSCRQGCAFCCLIQVMVTDDEADLLVSRHQPVSPELIPVQARWPEGTDGYIRHPPGKRRCPYLGRDNLCAAYADRPAACRAHLAISPASECDADRHPRAKPLYAGNLEASILLAAGMQVGQSGPMAHQLVKATSRVNAATEDN